MNLYRVVFEAKPGFNQDQLNVEAENLPTNILATSLTEASSKVEKYISDNVGIKGIEVLATNARIEQ